MELPRPNPSDPALLALGPIDPNFLDLQALCHGAQIRLDRADTADAAFELFLERGGHDAVLCSGALRADTPIDALITMLRHIDPELELWDLVELRGRLAST